MEQVLLINYDDILFYTNVSPHIDQYKLNPHILNSQILYIEPILGTDLYEKLLDLVDTNAITATTYADYKTLLINYITPSLVFHTMELFIPLNSFQLADGGTFQFTPSNANYSPLDEIDKLSNKYKIIGGKYDSKLEKYLCENGNSFPEYINNTGLIDKTKPTNRISGWNLNNCNVKYPLKR